ncbi:MFS transporter [Psychromicrobium xiongbiense]|uniref:MFS transporter n=1 Tax=Psychromicrobium xiongbiense TaxID=3051184 RepID=UPI0025520F17|nr:MFS transporter [Psychromicrobium sp. YIM S02556]
MSNPPHPEALNPPLGSALGHGPTRPSHVGRGQVLAWASWDWGSAGFNAVMTTFIFTAFYLTSDIFGGADHASVVLGAALGIAGFLIAILAPVAGQRSDHSGRRRLWLGINTGIVVLLTGSCFFVLPEPGYLLLGCGLLAAGHVFSELASVNYNAMLLQISTPKTIGRISGIGWACGYLGGIVALLILYYGLLAPQMGFFGITEETLKYRVVALFSALWIAVFSLPVLWAVPEVRTGSSGARSSGAGSARVGFLASYLELGRTIARLWRTRRHTLYFLISSAVFRDGLAAIFTFGAVIAVGTFGFSKGQVLIFAIAGNVVAAIGAFSAGYFDDKLGPKTVIIISLAGLLVSGTILLFSSGTTVFWIFGLLLCLFVGPAQSSARTFVGRLAPAGAEGELYGLYATTGRAASFIAPGLFTLFIAWFGAQRWGIAGIMIVLLAGLALLIPVKSPAAR